MQKTLLVCSLLLSSFAQGCCIEVNNNTNGKIKIGLCYIDITRIPERHTFTGEGIINPGEKIKINIPNQCHYQSNGISWITGTIEATKLENIGSQQKIVNTSQLINCTSLGFSKIIGTFNINDTESGIAIQKVV